MLAFYFKAGENTITINSDRANFALNYLKLYNEQALPEYEAPSDADLKATQGQKIVIEGEDATYKNDRTLYPTSDRNSYLTSDNRDEVAPTKTRYNTIGKDNWNQATQSITWDFTVAKDGYYKIGIRARQDIMRGLYSNRRMYIDGVVPNQESNQIKFYYDTDWDVIYPEGNNGDPIYYYLEAGTHEITLEAIPGEIGEIMDELEEIVYNITSYYRRIREITGPSPDEYIDYKIDKSIPTIIEDFKEYSIRLREIQKEIEKLSGSEGSEAVTLDKMAIVLDKCTAKGRAYRIPSMLSQIKDNITSVSAWMQTYRGQALEIDMIEITSSDVDFASTKKNFFKSLSFNFKAFIGSFFEDYNSLSADAENSITVWVSLGRDQAQVVKELVDNEFNPNSDVKASINLVQGGIVEATLAGKGPDIALFIGGDFPIQLAARGVLTDISQFPDYEEVTKRFTETAPVLYTYNDGVYGLPVSQTFPMLFYRKDILSGYGIDAEKDLETWDGFIDTLPVLQRSYKAAGLVLQANIVMNGVTTVPTTTEAGNTFATLLLQKGLNFYNENMTETTFESQEAIDSFEMWTKFYTTYNFEQTYDPFTRFRTGDMPIVISGYTFYNQLSVAAPEIKGCWDFMQIPGTVQEDGTVSHASNSGGSGAIIFENCENQKAAWEFIKWFTSTDAQVSYGNDIEALMGTMGRFDTANIEALGRLSWSQSEYELLKTQMLEQIEIPIIPATYSVTRNLTNAFRTVVNDAENSRDTLMWYNRDINAEIKRKLEDLDMYSEELKKGD
ncbi:MAG: extracellular solute-binding protein, partial [Bacteroidales bacterium]|nr:extracellular solute-binding protein [Bacteroidales bacterium]